MNRKGFTIVELLIVVIVIAVLASITIVTFNGIQNRAKASRYAVLAKQIVNGFEMYKIDHGDYPKIGTAGTLSAACVGSAELYPAEKGFTAGQCIAWKDGSSPNQNKVDASLANRLQEIIPKIPTEIFREVASDNLQMFRGVYYNAPVLPSFTTHRLTYWLQGRNQKCAAPFIASNGISGTQITSCIYNIPQ